MRGLGDVDADTDGDRAISLKELSLYLTRNVDRWARQHRGIRQRPALLGSAEDLPLASLNRKKTRTWAVWGNPEKPATSDNALEKAGKAQEKAQKKDAPQGGNPEKKEAEKSKETNDKTAPSPGKDSGEQAPTPSGPAYPDWLARGWQLHERWAAGPELAAGPRLFRQLDVHLLRSERDWRTGKDPGVVATALEEAITRLTARMELAMREKRPSERSVGQALRFRKTRRSLARQNAPGHPRTPATSRSCFDGRRAQGRAHQKGRWAQGETERLQQPRPGLGDRGSHQGRAAGRPNGEDP